MAGRVPRAASLGTDDGWRRPSMDEVAAAGRKTGLLRDEGGEDEPEETVDDGTSEEGSEEQPDAEGEGGEESEQETKPEGEEGEEQEEPAAKVIKLKGKEYTLDELEELVGRGTLREDDYTRKTMELATERRMAREEIKAAREERESYLKLNQALLKKAGILDEQGTTEEEQVQDPVAAKQIRTLNATIKDLTGKLDEGEKSRATQAQNDFIGDIYDTQMDTLFRAAKVEDPDFKKALHKLIQDDDPAVHDPETGKISEDVIRKSVAASFSKWFKVLKGQTKKAVGDAIGQARKATARVAPKPKPGVTTKPRLKPGQSNLLKNATRRRGGWDSDRAVGEILTRVSELSRTED